MAGYTIPSTPPKVNIEDLQMTPNSVIYADIAGTVTILPLGNINEVLTSQGPTSTPVWALPGALASTDVGLVLALGG